MERENRAWTRSFATGAVVLALAVGGQFASASPESSGRATTLSIVNSVIDRFVPSVSPPVLVHRITRAALDAAFGRTCG